MDNITNSPAQTIIPPENNQTPPSHPRANPLIVISLIVLMILIAAGSFVLGKFYTENKTEPVDETLPIVQKPVTLPTADPTTDWKTFTDEKFGVELKYPASWELMPTISLNEQWKEANILDVRFPNTKADHGYLDGGYLLVNVVNYFDSPNKLIEERNKYRPQALTTPYQFSGANGFLVTINNDTQSGQNWLRKEIYFKYKNFIYTISYEANGINKKEIFTTFDQILSTFRFLNEEGNPTPEVLIQEPEPTSSPKIILKYNVPDGWITTPKIENLYTISYDPKDWQQSCYKGCSILLTKNQIYHFQTYTLPYDGGSRRALLQKQFTGPFEEFVEIEIDGKRGLMAPLKWNANFDNEIIFGIPRGDKMIIVKTNLLINYGEKSSGFDRDFLYKFLGTLKID